MEQFKTGGGKPEIRSLTGVEESILSMLPSSIQGLPSIWDSDQSLRMCISFYLSYILSYLK